jgi:rhodanese-related sulfurtransferase
MNIVKSATAAYKEIDVNQMTHLINRENGVVLDIRTKDEFKKGHITDSVHILPSEIKAGNVASLENHKSDPIIVVCKTGQTAQESANLLAKAGFANVNLLKNGLVAWNEANLPLIRGKK